MFLIPVLNVVFSIQEFPIRDGDLGTNYRMQYRMNRSILQAGRPSASGLDLEAVHYEQPTANLE